MAIVLHLLDDERYDGVNARSLAWKDVGSRERRDILDELRGVPVPALHVVIGAADDPSRSRSICAAVAAAVNAPDSARVGDTVLALWWVSAPTDDRIGEAFIALRDPSIAQFILDPRMGEGGMLWQANAEGAQERRRAVAAILLALNSENDGQPPSSLADVIINSAARAADVPLICTGVARFTALTVGDPLQPYARAAFVETWKTIRAQLQTPGAAPSTSHVEELESVLRAANGETKEPHLSRWVTTWQHVAKLEYARSYPDEAKVNDVRLNIEVVARQLDANVVEIVRRPSDRAAEERLPKLIEEAVSGELNAIDRMKALERAAANIRAIAATVAAAESGPRRPPDPATFAGRVRQLVDAVRAYCEEQRQSIRRAPFTTHVVAAAVAAAMPAANVGEQAGSAEAGVGTAVAAIAGLAALVILRQRAALARLFAGATEAVSTLAAGLTRLSGEQEQRFRERAQRRRARKARLHAAKWQRRLERLIRAINAQVDAAQGPLSDDGEVPTLAAIWNIQPQIEDDLTEAWRHRAATQAVATLRAGGDLEMPPVTEQARWPGVSAPVFEQSLGELAAPLPLPLTFRLTGIGAAYECSAVALERLPLTAEQHEAFRLAWMANNSPRVRPELLLSQRHASLPGITVSRFVIGIPPEAVHTALGVGR